MALGALLGIGINPICRLRIIGTLFEPALDDGTAAGSVIIFSAAKAEDIGAGAFDCGNDDVERARRDRTFDGVLAVGGRTPAQVRVVVDVGPIK